MTIGKIFPVALLILVVSIVCSKCNSETTTHEDLTTINPTLDETLLAQDSKNAALVRVKRQFGYPYGYEYGYPYYRRRYYPYPLPIIIGGGFGPGLGFGGGRGFGGPGFGGGRGGGFGGGFGGHGGRG